MKLKLYQVDAFAQNIFEGNPAAVCPLQEWLDDTLMQKIANENNLSETAFFVLEDGYYHIRWFTPTSEVDMCGHATLASAYVLFEILGYDKKEIAFSSKSGVLKVIKQEEKYQMDFPITPIKKCEIPANLLQAFAIKPIECYKSMDYILVCESEQDIQEVRVDLEALKDIETRGVIITAPSEKYDFVNRMFAPKYGIDEDPVTGSAFTQLIPYWSMKLGKSSFWAKQVSQRGGEVFCSLKEDRVTISGYATKYMEALIEV